MINPTLSRVTQRIIHRSRPAAPPIWRASRRPVPKPSTARSWPAATWPTASPPVSPMTRRR
ncbi:hypothetical protein M5585_05285 [Serratia ureilytica]